jgi:hypothetical protein
MFLFHECVAPPCPAPRPQRQIFIAILQFWFEKKNMQQTIPFPKDHVTFQKKFTKIEK